MLIKEDKTNVIYFNPLFKNDSLFLFLIAYFKKGTAFEGVKEKIINNPWPQESVCDKWNTETIATVTSSQLVKRVGARLWQDV